jgi:hypothetical protein
MANQYSEKLYKSFVAASQEARPNTSFKRTANRVGPWPRGAMVDK